MSKLKAFLDRFGWRGFVSFVFYPIITLLTTPIRLCQTLWNCRVLAGGRDWGNYPHFSPHSALNSLFYWTAALNLCRFGRSGTSPYIGLGNTSLTRFFHYSLPSLYAYWKAGTVSLLVGMFGWWAGHFLWLDQPIIGWWWVISILTLALFSTTFYSNAFALQNYNVLGWLFVPVGIYGWLTEQWALATIAWLGVSFASSTIVFLIAILALAISIQLMTIYPVLTVIPGCLKLAFHFYPNVKQKRLLDLITIAKAVGLARKKVRYVRKHTVSFGIRRIYQLLIYSQFVFAYAVLNNKVPLLLAVSVVIWIINSKFARFSDDQSMYMLVLSTGIAEIIPSEHQSIWLIISYAILASPIPLFADFPEQKCLTVVPRYKPFNVQPILDEMRKFLGSVLPGERVLVAFDDPQGSYEELFRGYGVLLQVPLYVASERGFNLIPDWSAVFELNYDGAPDFWGREVEDVESKMAFWKADFVVVYQETGTTLDEIWARRGFRKLSHFSWAKFEGLFDGMMPHPGSPPEWWLLKKRS